MWSGATTISWLTFRLILCRSLLNKLERRADSHSPTQNTITFGIRIFISLLAIGSLSSAVYMENEFQLLSGGRLVCSVQPRCAPPVREEGGWLLDEDLESVANVTYFLSVFHRCWLFYGSSMFTSFKCELPLLVMLMKRIFGDVEVDATIRAQTLEVHITIHDLSWKIEAIY